MKTILKKNTKIFIFAIITILLCTSLWQLSSASRVHLKAILAQQLLNHSWNLTQDDSVDDRHKPWPWADTWPVAKLIVPQHDIKHIVLAGDSGNSLAFGPGYSLASAAPNALGTTVISGHRDTHFNFLKDIKINDTLFLQTADKTTHYRIYDLQVIDSESYTLSLDKDEQVLVLVTCYPFDALTNGGLLRYLVFASEVLPQNNIS